MRAADRIPTRTSPMEHTVLRAAVASRGIGPASPLARYWRVITELQRRGLLRREGAVLVVTDAGRTELQPKRAGNPS
jgi:hypothetical protein